MNQLKYTEIQWLEVFAKKHEFLASFLFHYKMMKFYRIINIIGYIFTLTKLKKMAILSYLLKIYNFWKRILKIKKNYGNGWKFMKIKNIWKM